MFKMFKKALSVTLSVTLLLSTIIVGGMFSFSASAATDLSGTEMPSSYTFDFDTVNSYVTNTTTAGTPSTDQYGNTFYPVTHRSSGEGVGEGATITYNGSDVTTLKITNNGKELRYIPTDANGYPYIIEPNTEYKVSVTYYTKFATGANAFYVGGGATNPDKVTSASDGVNQWNWSSNMPVYMTNSDGSITNKTPVTAWPIYSSAAIDSVWRGNSGTEYPTVSFTTTETKFITQDFDATNAQFTYTYNDGNARSWKTGAYFAIFFDPAGYGGTQEYYIDSITITKPASATLDANGGYFGDYATEGATTTQNVTFTAGDAINVTPSHPDSSVSFAGWSLDGVMVTDNTYTAAMDGKTLKAVWTEEDLSYTFNFDTVPTVTTTTSTGGTKATDQFGNPYYPALANSDTTAVAEGATLNYNGDTVTALRIASTTNGQEFRYIPVGDDGYPYIVEPNSTYNVSVTYYTKQTTEQLGFFVGGCATNVNGVNNLNGNYKWLNWGHFYVTENGVSTQKTSQRLYNPIYSTSIIDYADRGNNPVLNETVSFTTVNTSFITGDFTATNGKYNYTNADNTFDTGAYFVISLSPYQIAYDISQGYAVPQEYYIDSITITKSSTPVNVTFDANGGSFASGTTLTETKTPGAALSASETPTNSDSTLSFMGWSWYKDSTATVDTVTTGMNGKTLYAVWGESVAVTFNANGGAFADGEAANTSSYQDGDALVAPTAPTRKNYNFLGWAESADATAAITLPTNVTNSMNGKTYYAVWQFDPHGSYDTFNRVIDYSKYTVSVTNNSYCANDNYSYPWHSIGSTEAGSLDGKYLHFKAPVNIGGTDYYPSSWAPHYSLIMTESGTHTNSGDITDANNLYLPENTTYRVTLRMKTVNLSGQTMTLAVGYGSSFMATSPSQTLLTGIGEMSDWTEVSAVFTTPASYTEGSERCILNLTIGNCSANSWAFEYMIDTITLERVTATTLYTVDGGTATEVETVYGVPGTDLTLPTNVTKENYTVGSTVGSVSTTPISGWYSDNTVTTEAVTKFANADVSIYGNVGGDATTSSTVNQDGYCGFDTYAPEIGTVSFVTNEDAYTGSYSAKASASTDIEVRNNDAIALVAGKTYRVSLAYKVIENGSVTVAMYDGTTFMEEAVLELTADGEWNTTSVTITPDKGYADGYALILRAAGVYLDNIVVSSVTEAVGASTEDGTNLRFMMTYNGTDKVVIEGIEYNVVKRGITVKGADSADAVLTFEKTSDFDQCWSYNTVTGAVVYSANIEGFENTDTDKITAQGYVELEGGAVYYTDLITVSMSDIPAASDFIPEGADLNDYYVYLPEGTEFADSVVSTVSFYSILASGATEAENVLSGNVMTYGAYAKFTAVPDIADITVPAELMYTVHSGAVADLAYGLDAQIATYNLDEVGDDTVNYIFITDPHYYGSYNTASQYQDNTQLAQMKLITNMANNDDSIDFVVVGGDVTTGMYETKADAITYTQEILEPLKWCEKPVFVLMGNHDDNSYHDNGTGLTFDPTQCLSNYDWTNYITNYVNVNAEINKDFTGLIKHNTNENAYKAQDSKYYYYDIEKNGKTTRVVSLDAADTGAQYDENGIITNMPRNMRGYESDGNWVLWESDKNAINYANSDTRWGYGAEQLRWLAEDVLAGFNGDVIFLSHMGIDSDTNSRGTPIILGSQLRKIISAYQSKSSLSNLELRDQLADVYDINDPTNFTERESLYISVDYAENTGKIVSYQFGHMHAEVVLYSSDVDLWQICSSTSNYANAGSEYTIDEKVYTNKTYPWRFAHKDNRLGTNDEACFDVMSVSRDMIYKFNVGFGCNETLVYPN